MNLFKKAACFTDLHFGKKSNSRQFNTDCENFIHWFIAEAQAANCETCIFLGDWHDTRRFVNVSTLNYSMSNLELLNDSFETVYLILGNHDLYYREKREINSILMARNLKNIHIIEEITSVGNCSFIPWLVDEEWKKVESLDSKYIFGHFEIPHFKMNAKVEMPDKGELQSHSFKRADLVFTGHFHKRQKKDNIWYIGNAFPHNFSDAWDEDRGMMFLEWDTDPIFKTWPDQPLYRTMKLSDVIDDPDYYLNDKVTARVTADVDLTYEETTFLKDTLMSQYKCRDIVLTSVARDDTEFEFSEDVEFQSVDQIVIEGLTSVESPSISSETLIEMYASLEVDLQ